MAKVEVLDAYFRQADRDQDGRISGAEAVAFFKGANLPQPILAKIWQYSDQGQRGFLSREEFYNALKLVTVAQSGRELTPDIVRAVFASSASLQIPAPQITSRPPSGLPPTKNGVPLQTPTLNNAVHQHPPVGGGQKSQYPTPASSLTAGLPFMQARPNSDISVKSLPTTALDANSWFIAKPSSPDLQVEMNGTTPSNVQPMPSPRLPGVHQSIGGPSFTATTPNAFNGAAAYRASSTYSPASANTNSTVKTSSAAKPTDVRLAMEESVFGSLSSESKGVFQKVAPETPAFPGRLSNNSMQANHGSLVGTNLTELRSSMGPNPVKQSPLAASEIPSAVSVPTDSTGQGLGAPIGLGADQPWRKMSPSDVAKYSRIFIEVDTDKDGKISGVQARDLFLSWQLPREVLKQIWDLSDQDGDSMLSLREFCTSLYLMERHREGRPLPPALPASFHLEVNGLWQSINASQVAESQITSTQMSGPVAPVHAASLLQIPTGNQMSLPTQTSNSNEVDSKQEVAYKSKAPTLEVNLVNQLSKEEQENLKSKQRDAEEADKKVFDLDKDMMDSQKKIETYRTKLQEIILLKSRCDNRLAEVTEISYAEKREVDTLAKKYDAKFKQAGEVNSRLQAEEGVFRDIQVRKMELYNSIAHIEQADTSNSSIQDHVNHLAVELNELRKLITARAKQIGLRLKSAASLDATGGHLEFQESFIDWDEDWDKFDDEGFTAVQGSISDTLTSSTTIVAPLKPIFGWDEENLFEDNFDFSMESHKQHKPQFHSDETTVLGSETAIFDSPRALSEVGSQRSDVGSPQYDTLSPGAQSIRKGTIGDSLLGKVHSRYDHVGESQDFDAGNESFWPPKGSNFDSNDPDDADKVPGWGSGFGENEDKTDPDIREPWGLKSNPPSIQQESHDANTSTFNMETGSRSTSDFDSFNNFPDFGSLRVSTSSNRLGTTTKDEYDVFGALDTKGWGDKSSHVTNADFSVPGTPLFKVDSPRKSSSLLGDEFNIEGDRFSRFDSFSNTRSVDRTRALGSFDEGDPFAGTGPFGVTKHASKPSELWGAF